MALDASGYLASVTNAAQETTQFGYDAEGLLRTKTDPRQNTYLLTYTTEAEGQAGLLKRDQNPEGGFLEFERDLFSADNPKISWRTAFNRRTESEVGRDTSGKKLQILTYPNRTQKTLTQEDGTQTIGYSNGEKLILVKVPDPRFGMQALYLKTLSYQTPSGKTLTLDREKTVEMQDATKITNLLSQAETVTLNGKSWRSGYEKASNTLTATSPEGRARTVILNAQGRPASVQIANWAATHYSYDPHGRIETITQGEGASQRQTEISYDAAGNIKTITNAEQQSTAYPQYDGIGRLQKVVQPEDRTTQLSYDKNGNLETVIPPEKPAHQLGYNKIDQENSYDPPDIGLSNDKTNYRYNLDKQLTTIERPDGQTLTLNYNPSSGQLETLQTPLGACRT